MRWWGWGRGLFLWAVEFAGVGTWRGDVVEHVMDGEWMVMQVQTFLAALRALSRREVQYGAYATSEEVSGRRREEGKDGREEWRGGGGCVGE